MTSALFYHVLHALNVTIEIRNVCVFLAPLFSSLTVIVTYHLTKELKVLVQVMVELYDYYECVHVPSCFSDQYNYLVPISTC